MIPHHQSLPRHPGGAWTCRKGTIPCDAGAITAGRSHEIYAADRMIRAEGSARLSTASAQLEVEPGSADSVDG